MKSVVQIAWLAGILEGEGSFILAKGSPRIQISMTDLDVMERVASAMQCILQAPWCRPNGNVSHLPVHRCVVHGQRAIALMMTVYTFMGNRRKAKIREVIAGWRASSRAPRALDGAFSFAKCHPERRVCGNGLCKSCYMRQWREDRKVS